MPLVQEEQRSELNEKKLPELVENPKELGQQSFLLNQEIVFFCMFLADTYTCPILVSLTPLFWIYGDASFGFQSRVPIRTADANVM